MTFFPHSAREGTQSQVFVSYFVLDLWVSDRGVTGRVNVDGLYSPYMAAK